MKIKDRVVMKDYFLSVLCSGGVGILIFMVFLPILFLVLGKQLGEEFPTFFFFASGALESIGGIECITHIVLGALVLQYMRLYMFMGLTREKAYLKIMMVEGLTLIVTFLFLLIVGVIGTTISRSFDFSYVLNTSLTITVVSLAAFGVGCLSSSLSTTCRPPLSVGVIIAVLAAISWLYGKVTHIISETIKDADILRITLKAGETINDMAMTAIFGVLMVICAFFVYKLHFSNMKSTAIN